MCGQSKYLQQIALEFNLSETAFNLIQSDSNDLEPHFGLRWFTPTVSCLFPFVFLPELM